jgi:hypothetical protein
VHDENPEGVKVMGNHFLKVALITLILLLTLDLGTRLFLGFSEAAADVRPVRAYQSRLHKGVSDGFRSSPLDSLRCHPGTHERYCPAKIKEEKGLREEIDER